MSITIDIALCSYESHAGQIFFKVKKLGSLICISAATVNKNSMGTSIKLSIKMKMNDVMNFDQ